MLMLRLKRQRGANEFRIVTLSLLLKLFSVCFHSNSQKGFFIGKVKALFIPYLGLTTTGRKASLDREHRSAS